MISELFNLLCADFCVQWIGWIVSSLLHTEKFYDLVGSATFVLLVNLACRLSVQNTLPLVVKIQTAMVSLWALRLGLFLFLRVMRSGGDWRFNRARDSPKLLFVYWSLQGVWVFITLLPTLVMTISSGNNTIERAATRTPTWQHYIGWSLWIVGFLLEVIADYQKSVFRNDPANKHGFISSGLWAVSRHPNYLGEIMLWCGLYISATAARPSSCRLRHLLVLCPVFNWLLISRLSGVPLLEQAADRKWRHLAEYQRYRSSVPVLVPFIGSV